MTQSLYFEMMARGTAIIGRQAAPKDRVDLCASLIYDTYSSFWSLGSCTKFKLTTIKLNPLISKMN